MARITDTAGREPEPGRGRRPTGSSWRWPWRRRAPASLFARLLALQLLVACGLMLSFGLLVYAERTASMARLVADRWAPVLRAEIGLADQTETAPPLLRSAGPPAHGVPARHLTPRLGALWDELAERGLPVADLRVAPGPVVWLNLRGADGRTHWVGLPEDALPPPGRLLLALACGAALFVLVSWHFTRRLTQPLEHLRARMARHQPGAPAATEATADEPPAAPASPEIAAIGAAYDELLQRLQRHERERALLLAGVSHDLRSPLARIRMAAALLPDEPGVAARREAIERNIDVADRLIGSFLDHVRAGELAFDESADLAALARRVVAGQVGRTVALDAPAALPVGATQPLLLERLIGNLIDNAFRHGAEPVALRVAREGAEVLIEVSDAGPGVPRAHQAQVLQAFARIDASRGTPGTGLGLAVVARIAERMGGGVTFRHEGGRHVVRVHWPERVAATAVG